MKRVAKTTNWLIKDYNKEELESQKALATIAAKIHMKRIEMDLDQKQFASLCGVSQGMVSRWESGTYNFTISTLVNICNKLELVFKPQITSKEVADIVVQKIIYSDAFFSSSNDTGYSNWTPSFKRNREKGTKVEAVA